MANSGIVHRFLEKHGGVLFPNYDAVLAALRDLAPDNAKLHQRCGASGGAVKALFKRGLLTGLYDGQVRVEHEATRANS